MLSKEPYPFADVWVPIRSVLDAFGAERVMWASDISRFAGRIGWRTRYPRPEVTIRASTPTQSRYR